MFNRNHERTDKLMAEHGSEGRFHPAKTIEEFVDALAKPRAIIIMVKAGKPVDDMIDELVGHLDPDDIIIDGGNSLFTDTARRFKRCRDANIRFIGMGISGGEEGALEGPSMMPGGERSAYDRIAPMVTKMAVSVDGTPCCTYIGTEGAGHYVKMVHNGIEYADMQLITEAYDLMKTLYGLDAGTMADIFTEWKAGDLDSYLIEITAAVLRKTDGTGKPLVDAIVDEAEQKGTGRWTAQNALEMGVPVTAITEAVFARALSGRRGMRAEAEKALPHPAVKTRTPTPEELNAIRDALYASKIIAYAQGFEQMTVASETFEWGLHLGEISTIWRGGCIIRARFLNRIREAYERNPKLSNLLLDDYFRDAVGEGGGGLGETSSCWRCRTAWLCRPSPRRWPITTASAARVAPPTCCRVCATISARIPIAAWTRRGASTPAGARTAARSRPNFAERPAPVLPGGRAPTPHLPSAPERRCPRRCGQPR